MRNQKKKVESDFSNTTVAVMLVVVIVATVASVVLFLSARALQQGAPEGTEEPSVASGVVAVRIIDTTQAPGMGTDEEVNGEARGAIGGEAP